MRPRFGCRARWGEVDYITMRVDEDDDDCDDGGARCFWGSMEKWR